MPPLATCASAAAALAALLAVAAHAAAPGARPLGRSSCGPIQNPAGKHLIASDLPLRGAARAQALEMSKAIAFVLEQHDWRAGPYTLAYQSCDDSTAAAQMWDARKCAGNARAYARNRHVVGVIGTFNSGCAEVALPILNQAANGAVAMVSPANTSIGLTHRGPGTEPDEPQRYYPSGKRNYARVIAPDDAQAAADAILARQLGVKSVFVLHDGGAYGVGVATAFRAAAARLGLTVVGFGGWDPSESSYDLLARGIKASRAQGVFLGGLVCANGSKLVRDLRARLGAGTTIIAADGFTPISALAAGAGSAAEGIMVSVAGRPNDKLPPAGRRFIAAFAKVNGGKAPDPFSVHAAQATEVLLQAIATSDGTRGDIARRLLGVKIRNGILGTFGFDSNGDASAPAVTIYRIRDGKGWQDTVIVPPAALIKPA
jgi:branched-chain amino acid transport system substrate-binding protein